MTLVQKTAEFFVVLKDRGSNYSRLNFKSTVDATADAEALLDDLITNIAALTYAKIVKAGFTWYQEEGDKSVGTGNGEIEKKAEISVALVTATPPDPGQTEWGQITIPAPVDGMFQAASGSLFNVVKFDYAALQTFLTMFTVGWGVGDYLTLSDGQAAVEAIDNASNVYGKRITKGSRKG